MRDRGKPRESVAWLAFKAIGVLIVSALLVVVALGVMTRKIQVDRRGIRLAVDTQRKVTVWGRAAPVEGISTDRDEYEAAISPDGTEMYLVRQTRQGFADIFVSLRRNNRWTRPQPLTAINTAHDETSPRLTPDGEYLLFASERPGGQGRYDIWASKRNEEGWDPPFNLGPQVNSAHDEHSPSLTPDGRRLFLASNRNEPGEVWGGKVRQQAGVNFDIFVAESAAIVVDNIPVPATRPAGLEFRAASAVSALNTKQYDGSCMVSPRGDYLYFTSNRSGGFGGFDIYRAALEESGAKVGPAENLSAAVNTIDNESDPAFANAGFLMYFSSDRVGSLGADDLYVSELRDLLVTQRGAGALPKLGVNGWLLLAAVGLFFPMLVLARSSTASLLQKGIVLSLMAHLVMVMLFSGVKVSRAMVKYVRQELGMEIPVNLEASSVAELRLQVRNQITQVAAPTAEVSVPRIETYERAIQPPPQVAVSVPGAAIERAAQSPLEPRVERRIETEAERVAMAAPLLDPVTPEVKLPTPAPVRSDEAVAQAKAPQPEFERVEPKLTAGAEQISLGSVPLRPDTAVPGPVVAATSALPPLPDAVEMGTQINVEILPDVSLPQAQASPVVRQAAEAAPAAQAPVIRAAVPEPVQIARAAPTAELSVPKMSAAPPSHIADPLAGASIASIVSKAVPADLELAPPIAAMDILPPSLGENIQKVERQPLVSLADVVPVPRATDARPLPAARRGDALRPAESILGVARHGSAIDVMPDEAGLREALETGIEPVEAHAQVALLTGPMGPRELFTVETLAQRAQEQRQQMIEELGGNAATEGAVNRSLAWLARNQMADGRWTKFHGPRSPLRDRDNHDIALTALASLCFLGADHTPAKEGSFRETVRRGLEFMASQQSRSGDLRGRGNMYDHAMATIALSEAAYMTGDERYRALAMKGAEFIVAAQREDTGGWQYAPGEFGDTSVTGWCLMALHSAERVGFPIPPRTKQAALKWLQRVTAPGDSLLAGYQNRTPATPSMTAKNVFCRILLGETLSPAAVKQASDFITSNPPGSGERDYYYWYYASISLMQLQNDAWTRWNLRARDYLLSTQRGDGEATGSWDADAKWADRGGRVYCTAMATLTLEVYYRYLPMYAVRARPVQ